MDEYVIADFRVASEEALSSYFATFRRRKIDLKSGHLKRGASELLSYFE